MSKLSSLPPCMKVMSTKQYFARLKHSVGSKSINFREADWMNTNRLLWKSNYIGGKTGQTVSAGNCLANVYGGSGVNFFIVVLGCSSREDRFLDTEKLVSKFLKNWHQNSSNNESKSAIPQRIGFYFLTSIKDPLFISRLILWFFSPSLTTSTSSKNAFSYSSMALMLPKKRNTKACITAKLMSTK